jgi:hypothetical protein
MIKTTVVVSAVPFSLATTEDFAVVNFVADIVVAT